MKLGILCFAEVNLTMSSGSMLVCSVVKSTIGQNLGTILG